MSRELSEMKGKPTVYICRICKKEVLRRNCGRVYIADWVVNKWGAALVEKRVFSEYYCKDCCRKIEEKIKEMEKECLQVTLLS